MDMSVDTNVVDTNVLAPEQTGKSASFTGWRPEQCQQIALVLQGGGALMTMTLGQPCFFKPHKVNPWLSLAGARAATSFYDASPLAETLEELVDFRLINDGPGRFAVGAVNILSGNFVYFDNRNDTIAREHVTGLRRFAAGSPHGEDRYRLLLGRRHRFEHAAAACARSERLRNTLIFQVDLFSARGQLPRDMHDVLGRHRDIMYSSRTRYNTDVYRRLRDWKTKTYQALKKVPEELLSEEERQLRDELAELPEITILHQQKACK